jgi:putative PIN family toxin of toxin-antitoxin system
MKVVTDTNVAISGLLWGGPPNEILKMARSRSLSVLACDETVQELKRAITYKKFRRRLAELKMSGDDVYAYFVNLALFVPSPRERNVSMKMRHPDQEITLPSHQLKMGLLIQTASGKVGGVGILPLNLFGYFSYASANTVERRSKTSSAMQ